VHGEAVTAVAPIEHGKIALGTASGELYLATLAEIRAQIFHQVAQLPLPVLAIATSSDGKSIAALCNDWTTAEVAVYRAGQPTAIIRGIDPSEASVIALNETGSQLAVASFDVTIYDVGTSRLLRTLEFPPLEMGTTAATSVAFRPNGDVALLTNEGVQIMPQGGKSPKIKMGLCQCDSIAQILDPSTRHAIFRTKSGHLIVMAVDTGEVVADKTLSTDPKEYFDIAVSDDGRRLLAATPSGRFRLWDMSRQTTIARGSFPKELHLINFIGNQQLLLMLTGDEKHEVSYWVSSLQ